MRRIHWLFVLLAAPLTWACDAQRGIVAPERPVRELSSCTNALTPPSFSLVMENGARLPRITNHYVRPLSSRDSIRTRLNDGRLAWLAFGYGEGYCVTALDSAHLHTAGAVGYDP